MTTIGVASKNKRHNRNFARGASLLITPIRASVRVIAQHPEIGRPAEGMEPEYREWVIDFGDSGYIALYRYEGETALIVAVRHQKEVGYF